MSMPRINAEIVRCLSRPAWLAERRKRIQASDVAGILGESPWSSAMSIYAEKTSPAPLVDQSTERQSIGLELEAPICAMYRRKFGGVVHQWEPYAIAASREYAWLGATPDALVEDPDKSGIGLLEIKTSSEFARHQWEDSAPLHYQIQVQAALAVTGLAWGVLAVLHGVSTIERVYIDRNESFIAAMIGVLADFAVCVELRQPPAVDGSAATTRALAKLHPNDNGLAAQLPAEAGGLIQKLLRAKGLAKRLGERADAIENELKAAIGDNTYGFTPAGQWVSWKSQHRSAYTVAEKDFRVLRADIKPPKQIEYAGAAAPAVDFKVAERRQLPLEWKVRLLAMNPRCKWCGATLTTRTATLEHVVPLAVGGTNKFANIALACRGCNEARGSDATLPF